MMMKVSRWEDGRVAKIAAHAPDVERNDGIAGRLSFISLHGFHGVMGDDMAGWIDMVNLSIGIL